MGELDPLSSKPEANERIEKYDGSSTKLEESEKSATPSGSLRTILKYSDWKDMVLMTLGTFGCVADGLCMSAIMLVLSKLMNDYALTSLSLADIDKVGLKKQGQSSITLHFVHFSLLNIGNFFNHSITKFRRHPCSLEIRKQ